MISFRLRFPMQYLPAPEILPSIGLRASKDSSYLYLKKRGKKVEEEKLFGLLGAEGKPPVGERNRS